jgi:hypothetical protein
MTRGQKVFRRQKGQSIADYDLRDDLRNRNSGAVNAALAVGCPVCDAEPGEDCHNVANDLPLPRQRIVHFCRVPVSHARRIT